ncbi:hypothetical protein SISNIDRAFT_490932 [Sistotremastrum niveocremeum HHB9708]|uniref:Uncharacterized protein n=1 Tax=Sistotremastrum niveocremeum HHB9708 TaxID=1314777 RepID=A0A164NCK2_9AGAM|nr:hypothetical protein SISNIDRAFT_490932 [Sistotremastrum niveocremeum HHB9708]
MSSESLLLSMLSNLDKSSIFAVEPPECQAFFLNTFRVFPSIQFSSDRRSIPCAPTMLRGISRPALLSIRSSHPIYLDLPSIPPTYSLGSRSFIFTCAHEGSPSNIDRPREWSQLHQPCNDDSRGEISDADPLGLSAYGAHSGQKDRRVGSPMLHKSSVFVCLLIRNRFAVIFRDISTVIAVWMYALQGPHMSQTSIWLPMHPWNFCTRYLQLVTISSIQIHAIDFD